MLLTFDFFEFILIFLFFGAIVRILCYGLKDLEIIKEYYRSLNSILYIQNKLSYNNKYNK